MIFSVISLGCPKNLVDSERIIAQLGLEGEVFTDNESRADCVILNTCGFIKPAIDESTAEIGRLVAWKKRKPGRKLVVCGCLVNRMSKSLPRQFPQVDGWFKIEQEGSIGCPAGKHQVLTKARFLTTPSHFAYLKIAEGCRNRCSYCTIPSIRGPLRSRKPSAIIKEARALVDMGVREIALIAQDTTNYGYDFDGPQRLPHLLRALARIDGIKWLRLLYTHPAHIDDALIEEIANNRRVCKYIDMPIQHVNNRILKLMKRRYGRDRLLELMSKLRAIPGLAIRTTVMVGFPTERETEFEELLRFIDQTSFDHLGAFTYWAEPGTKAARLPQVASGIKTRRLNRIVALQFQKVKEQNRAQTGKTLQVVVDRINGRFAYARSQHEAPDIDRVIRLFGNNLKIGRFYQAQVTGFDNYDQRAVARTS